MRKFYERQIAHAPGQRFSLRKHQKLIGHQGGSRDARLFQLNGVVDTPRRARPSIGKGVDDYVAPVDQLLKTIRYCAGHFSFGYELNVVVALPEQVADIAKKFVCVGFVIVQQTDTPAA
jgi:hypothetical protein